MKRSTTCPGFTKLCSGLRFLKVIMLKILQFKFFEVTMNRSDDGKTISCQAVSLLTKALNESGRSEVETVQVIGNNTKFLK